MIREAYPCRHSLWVPHFISIYTGSQLIPSKGVNGTLFGLALLTVTARMGIRYHSQRQLQPDDFVLMFAGLALSASQIILYILNMDELYWIGALSLGPNPQILVSDPKAFYRRISKIQRMQYSSLILTWASIFAVKICFLLFFHQMITRLQRFCKQRLNRKIIMIGDRGALRVWRNVRSIM